MRDLASFQRDFADALMDGEPALSFHARAFAVYRNTSARGVVEALRASYPTVNLLLGDDGFTQVALQFRSDQPPATAVMSDYGRDFAGFLGRQSWTSELPYLADVAHLDWLWLKSFLAADAVAIPPRPAGTSRIALHPAARLAWTATPAMTIWLAHRDHSPLAELEPEWVEEGALFTRPGSIVRPELIEAPMYRLLAAVSVPATVADVVTDVAKAFPAADIPGLLRRGISSGALILM